MISELQKERYNFKAQLPSVLENDIREVQLDLTGKTESFSDQEKIKSLFPKTYGLDTIKMIKGKNTQISKKTNIAVILSGGQAPGGHNVISGIYDALKKGNKESNLYGFKGGPSGLLEDSYVIFTDSLIDEYRNTGGFDIIGSGRTKLETKEQFAKVASVCQSHDITGLIIIGGDDSNTNAAVLAEYFLQNNKNISVVGCPKTIDGDLKNQFIQTSFGFDTATKTYNELISNIARDANSAKKYWHFIKLMGRSASHIALECGISTRANITLISEEVEKKNLSLSDISEHIASVVKKRRENGENFGLVLIPEGLIEFVPAIKNLISELNDILAAFKDNEPLLNYVKKNLNKDNLATFNELELIQEQLIMDRDPHGNVQVSRIDTEKLLIDLVSKRLDGKFNALSHFFGYEGRCAFPSNFDANYCYSLGFNAVLLLTSNKSGYMSSISNLHLPAKKWEAGGIPITMMMNIERRHGEDKPVIKKALVDLDGKAFKYLSDNREQWQIKTSYIYTGAIQYYGPDKVCNSITRTLELEN